MASLGTEMAVTPTPAPPPATPWLRTPPSLAELSRKSTRLIFIPYVRSLACRTPHIGLRMVSVHINFVDRRISVSQDIGGGDEPPASGNHTRNPASKEAIKAMATVEMVETGSECAICLKEFVSGGEIVKKMPCEHLYHWGCIEKWLGIHGSCPVCRYEMPLEGEGGDNKENEFNENDAGYVGGESDEDYEGDEDEDEDEDGEFWEEAEQGGESYESGVVFNYIVNGSTGEVLDLDIDVVTSHGDGEE